MLWRIENSKFPYMGYITYSTLFLKVIGLKKWCIEKQSRRRKILIK